MAESERVTTSETRALTTLDIHYGMLLGSSASDLRRPGWTFITVRDEGDPMALLFGQRRLVQLISPEPGVPSPSRLISGERLGARAGVVLVVPELRAAVAEALRDTPPDRLFTHGETDALDSIIRLAWSSERTELEAAHLHVRYTTAESFQPYLGPWLDWIEPLDESREIDPAALSLLARYSRGAYVVRQGGAIVSYAGVRQLSPHVWELSTQTVEALRGHQLAQAVTSRATRAALAEGRLPLYAHPAGDAASERVALALGYKSYGDALTYSVRL